MMVNVSSWTSAAIEMSSRGNLQGDNDDSSLAESYSLVFKRSPRRPIPDSIEDEQSEIAFELVVGANESLRFTDRPMWHFRVH